MTIKTMPKIDPPQPGEDLLRAIRAGFVAQGTTFTQWCNTHGIHAPNARLAIRGGWRGPKATLLVRKLLAAAGVQDAA